MSMVKVKCANKLYKVGLRDLSKLISTFGCYVLPVRRHHADISMPSVIISLSDSDRESISHIMNTLRGLVSHEFVAVDTSVPQQFVSSIIEISSICSMKKALQNQIDKIIRTNRESLNEYNRCCEYYMQCGTDTLQKDISKRIRKMRELQEQVAAMNRELEFFIEEQNENLE